MNQTVRAILASLALPLAGFAFTPALAQDATRESCPADAARCASEIELGRLESRAAPSGSEVLVVQVGAGNRAEITAPNPDQLAVLEQRGDANTATLDLAASAGVELDLFQSGDENTASFVLANPAVSFAGVTASQVGGANRIEVTQRVAGAVFAGLTQIGEGNLASLNQEGENLSASLLQQGDGNVLGVTQVGSDLGIDVSQVGNGLLAPFIEQIGAGVPGLPPVVIVQTGP